MRKRGMRGINRTGKVTANGWKILKLAGYSVDGPRVWHAVRVRAARKHDEIGEKALVRFTSTYARRMPKDILVPEDALGAWRSWRGMLRRTGMLGTRSRGRVTPNMPGGGRYIRNGTEVHDEWVPKSTSRTDQHLAFEAFFLYIGPRPAGTHLDRIDPEGDYVPGNVRWGEKALMSANKRRKYTTGSSDCV